MKIKNTKLREGDEVIVISGKERQKRQYKTNIRHKMCN